MGIALIIAVSQLKDLLGLSTAHVPADLIHGLPALWAARSQVNLSAARRRDAVNRGYCIAPPPHSLVPWLPARRRRRVCARRLAPAASGYDLLALRRASCRTPAATHPALEHCTDRRAVAFRVPDRLSFGGGVASLRNCRRPDDRQQPPLECRTPRSRRRKHHLAFVRRAAGNRRDRENGDKCSRRRTHSSGGHCARGLRSF